MMPAIVFVLTYEPFHDNSTLIGVYQSKQGARDAGAAHAQRDLQWDETGAYAYAADQTKQPMNTDQYEIHEVSVLP